MREIQSCPLFPHLPTQIYRGIPRETASPAFILSKRSAHEVTPPPRLGKASSRRSTAETSARSTRWQRTGIFWCLIFGHLASLVWAKLILGRFRDLRCCLIFLDFLLVLTITSTSFSLTPVSHVSYCGRLAFALCARLLFAI